MWQEVGMVKIKNRTANISLRDLTGFNGRCDAIFFTKEKMLPPNDPEPLKHFAEIILHFPKSQMKQAVLIL
jgi:hypothetical protein